MKHNSSVSRRPVALVLGLLLLLAAFACIRYLTAFSPADDFALACLQDSDNVTVTHPRDGVTLFSPIGEAPTAGLIFYPGGKVQDIAYSPLLHGLAERGFAVLLVRMPCSLAIFASDHTSELQQLCPAVRHWWLGGHSLGGVVAAKHAAANATRFEGLLLLAAYSTQDLTDTGLQVISIYGTNDGVLNRKNYEKNRGLLPSGATELVLQGANHAQFGSYGPQKGDLPAGISPEEQRRPVWESMARILP